ncbi:MAG: YabP/YqfC family sporulation protein [Anaerovoracaceae bacterium]
MTIKEELLFDFAVNMPRVLVTGETTVLDNVKKLLVLTDTQIVVFNGRRYTSVAGRDFVVTKLKEERMLVAGEVDEIRFFKALQEDKD